MKMLGPLMSYIFGNEIKDGQEHVEKLLILFTILWRKRCKNYIND
jgi:hypothetical protein